MRVAKTLWSCPPKYFRNAIELVLWERTWENSTVIELHLFFIQSWWTSLALEHIAFTVLSFLKTKLHKNFYNYPRELRNGFRVIPWITTLTQASQRPSHMHALWLIYSLLQLGQVLPPDWQRDWGSERPGWHPGILDHIVHPFCFIEERNKVRRMK